MPPAARLTPLLVALALARAAFAAEPAPDGLPPPALELAPALVPPALRPASPARPAATPTPPTTAAPVAPLRPAGTVREPNAVFLRADTLEGDSAHVEATGRVELRSRTDTMLADWLRYDMDLDELWGKGDVRMRRGLDWITGPEARFRRDTETGFFRAPNYYFGENGARGTAEELRFEGPQRYEATNAQYTTCVAPRNDWYVNMGELVVDQSRKVGTGRHATVYFLGAPIAYTPWLEFPLSNERKSGFLTPTLGSTGIRGFELALPYYFNLAPNYDATLTPRVMTKRGLQMGGQFRYLMPTFAGEVDVEDLPNDRVTGTNRYALAWKHNHNLDVITPGLAAFWNLNKVSDDTYFADLSDRIAITSQTTLPREGGFVYTHGIWQVLARAQAFQTLQDPTAPPVVPPYNRMPQVQIAARETDWHGFAVAGTGEYVRFTNPQLVTGQRLFAYPTLAWTQQGAAWFFTARAGLHARHYEIDGVPASIASPNFSIPVTSLDGGLVFEREGTLFGSPIVQTLEPRAFYVYIPYRDQSQVPAFDTALDDFNFGQLFSENRYLGNDRIGDANQITLALTSRLIEPQTGGERLRLAIGQRFYFQNQRVTLSEQPRSASSSDVLLLAEGRLTEAWSLSALVQHNLDASRTERVNAGVRYTPAPGKVLNASYRYARQFSDPTVAATELRQFDLSGEWPVNPQWTLLGRWNYSLADRKTLEGVAGVEYNAGCWIVRLVGQRLTTTTQTTTTSVYLQLELNGLARFGTSPLDLLRRTVPGYLRTNDPTVAPRERGDLFPEF